MSSCLTGGRAYTRLDLEIIKSPSTSWASNSSSPSSTLSESSNSPLAILTRKPRTPRKRPNQTYNEAVAILSTAYPKIFPTKHLVNPGKFGRFTKPYDSTQNPPLLFDLMPFQVIDSSGYLLPSPVIERRHFTTKAFEKPCLSPGEITSNGITNSSSEVCDEYQEDQDFDTESILDEEIEQGIDSIMGNLSVENKESTSSNDFAVNPSQMSGFCYGYPIFGYGMRQEVRAIRTVDEGDWWRFPCVNVADITPKIPKPPVEKKKKKVELKNLSDVVTSVANGASPDVSASKSSSGEESVPPSQPTARLNLKLNYDSVLKEWSDKSSPFSGDEIPGNDVQVCQFARI